ncbi:TetR/AcrR family transcriptional regulator [Ekhidna sp. To15]|uniref:TetR/AcrR family transcriptional regulator n=1 Tax=Ekhidna sp. To15 TaxID=3395267 RepID=UPI003F51B278
MKSLSKTKLKIIETTVALFNKDGFADIGTRQIAAKLQISRGNLSYHYSGKEKMLPDIYQIMVSKRQKMLPALNESLSLKSIYVFFGSLTTLQVDYKFFFRDLNQVLSSSSVVRSQFVKHSKEHRSYDLAFIDQLVENEILIPEPDEGIYQNLAHVVWVTRIFWMSQEKFSDFIDVNNSEHASQVILDLFYPFLTDKGLLDYKMMKL